MKIVHWEKMVVDLSYEPVLRITLDIPYESVMDNLMVLGDKETKQILGAELLTILKGETNK